MPGILFRRSVNESPVRLSFTRVSGRCWLCHADGIAILLLALQCGV